MLLLKKKNLIVILPVFLIAVVLLVPQIAHAGINDILITISSWIANQIIYVVGQLLLIAINILIKVASFNDFINANIVNIGWVIIRDLANMAIVVALMVIAFYTVLNKESYEYKKMLPKLVLAAILVNFSKIFAGLLIDFGQVVMMTFVHAFEGIAAGNLTYGFGLQDMLSVRNTAQGAGLGAEISDWSVFGALVLGVIMVVVALGVVVSMAVMLLIRIIVLWLLIIFSPVAYVAGLIPGGQKHAEQWWGYFGKYIVFGPVLAFLFWLSMTVLSQVTEKNRLMNLSLQSQEYLAGGTASPETYTYFASQVSSPQRVFDYMVTCALLIMCMIFAKQAGVMGAQFAGNVFGKMQGAGRWIARRPGILGRRAGAAALGRAKTTYAGAGLAALAKRGRTSWVGKKIGLDKEYAEVQAAKKRARMAEWVGGKRAEGAIRSFEYQQAMKKQKEMQDKGLLEGGEDALRKVLYSKINTKKMDEAQAIMAKMSSDKDMNLKKEDYDKYEKAIGVTRNSGTRKERDMMMYFEALAASQKASGDAMAKYKTDVTRDSAGNLMYSDKVAQVKKDFSEKKEADFNNVGLFKAFDENLPEFREILNQLDGKTNMQALGTEGRRGYAKILQRMLARDADSSDSFKLSTDEEKTKYTGLLEKMHAKKFVTGTGEAILNEADAERTGDKTAVRKGNREFMEAIDPAKLTEVATKFKQKKAEETKEDRIYGREILTDVDKKIDQDILRPLSVGNRIQSDLYKMTNENRGEDINDFVSSVHANQRALESILLSEAAAKGSSDVINPDTGSPYSYTELYEKSATGKNMRNLYDAVSTFNPASFAALSPEEQDKFRKDLENRLDSVVFDVQRAYLPAGSPKGREKTGEHQRNKLLKNRTVNRGYLGQAINQATKLQTAALSTRGREKVIKNIIKNVKQANKHSKKHNLDKEFNKGLNALLQKAGTLDSGSPKNEFEDFVKDANVLFGQVQAK